MEPVTLTAVATAIATIILTKALEKTGEKLGEAALNESHKLIEQLRQQFIDSYEQKGYSE